MKPFIILFDRNGKNAQLLKGIDADQWQNRPNVLVNPDIASIRSVPMHLWTLKNGQIEVGTDSSETPEVGHVLEVSITKYFWLKVVLISLVSSAGGIALAHYFQF